MIQTSDIQVITLLHKLSNQCYTIRSCSKVLSSPIMALFFGQKYFAVFSLILVVLHSYKRPDILKQPK